VERLHRVLSSDVGLPVDARMLCLYITHALYAHNAAPNEAFQNIIGDAQAEGMPWFKFIEDEVLQKSSAS
jgi:hypothetical protein